MASHPAFYKLCSREVADIVLRNRTLRWSTPGTFNDPFDCQFNLYFASVDDAMRDEVIQKQFDTIFNGGPASEGSPLGRQLLRARGRYPKMTLEQFAEDAGPSVEETLANATSMQDEFLQMMKNYAATQKILCLTDRFDSVLMWSHYAEQHRGLALRFDTPDGVDSPWRLATRIQYQKDLPLALSRDELSDFAAGRLSLDPEALARTMLLTKAAGWSYESEWRIVSGDGRARNAAFEDVKFHPKELTGIILGARMPSQSKEHLSALARAVNPNIEVFTAELATRSFLIEASCTTAPPRSPRPAPRPAVP